MSMETRKFDVEKGESEVVGFLSIGRVACQECKREWTVEEVSERDEG